jgi:hypothetical protein
VRSKKGGRGVTQKNSPSGENQKIREIREKIAELKRRWPAHSVKIEMVEELERLEEELAKELARENGDHSRENGGH